MNRAKSAYGTKRTSPLRPTMSAFGGKADIEISGRNVRFWHKAASIGYLAVAPAYQRCETTRSLKLSFTES
jgi:hypothetical protein